jgi:hypothetical protein
MRIAVVGHLLPHSLAGPGEPFDHELVRPAPVRDTCLEVDHVHLELLPAARGKLEQWSLPTADIPRPARPRVGRHGLPGLFEDASRPTDILDDVGGRTPRAGCDRCFTTGIPTVVLIHHHASSCGVCPTDVAVGVAGHVAEHMPDGPPRQRARTTHVLVGHRLDALHEAPVRVGDPGDVALGDHQQDGMPAVRVRSARRTAGAVARPPSRCGTAIECADESSGRAFAAADRSADLPVAGGPVETNSRFSVATPRSGRLGVTFDCHGSTRPPGGCWTRGEARAIRAAASAMQEEACDLPPIAGSAPTPDAALHDHYSDIVVPAVGNGSGHEHVGGRSEILYGCQHGPDLLVRHLVAQSVGAQQEAVSGKQGTGRRRLHRRSVQPPAHG